MSMAHTTSHARSVRPLLSRLVARFTRTQRSRLDPRTLSDHLKRDMGFLDGNDVFGGTRWGGVDADDFLSPLGRGRPSEAEAGEGITKQTEYPRQDGGV